MIMRGKTPRSLNRPGVLGMLGLAALLLPLSPTWAQKNDDAPREKPADLRPAETLTAPAADDLLKAVNEEVVRALKLVEAGLEQVGEKPGTAPRRSDDEPLKGENAQPPDEKLRDYKQTLDKKFRDYKQTLS